MPRGGIRSNAPAGLEAVEARHDHVEQDQVGFLRLDGAQSTLTAACELHLVALATQVALHQPQVRRHVIDDENAAVGFATDACCLCHVHQLRGTGLLGPGAPR